MTWTFVIAVVGLAGLFLAGDGSRWGWALGLSSQAIWLVLLIVSSWYTLIPVAVVYAAVCARNLHKWHRQETVQDDSGDVESTLEQP